MIQSGFVEQLQRIGTEPHAQKQGKSTVPQFQRTCLEQVGPIGSIQQAERDGLFFPKQSAVGDFERAARRPPGLRHLRSRRESVDLYPRSKAPRVINRRLRPGAGDPSRSRPLVRSMCLVFLATALVIVMIPLDRRSWIGMPMIGRCVTGQPGFSFLFHLFGVADHPRVEAGHDEERGRLTGQQSPQDRAGQRRVGLAPPLEGQRRGIMAKNAASAVIVIGRTRSLAALRIASSGDSPSCFLSSWPDRSSGPCWPP